MKPVPPCPAPAHWWWTRAYGLLLLWELWLGTYSAGFLFFSQVCRPLRFQSFPQTHLWEEFLLFGNFSSFTTPSPGRVSVPNSFVSLFVFYILSYLLSMRMGCLSGCLVSSTNIEKLFCGICSAFKWSFDEFVGEKVISPSYSSAILGPPHNLYFEGNSQHQSPVKRLTMCMTKPTLHNVISPIWVLFIHLLSQNQCLSLTTLL